MAANVLVTPGSGDTIAAEDISSVKYQKVKLIVSTAGSTTPVGDATTPLQVSLANSGANSNKFLVTPDLPSGASTAAKQPALGTAGTASADVISIQGIASMTAVKVDGSAVTQPVSLAAGTLSIGKAEDVASAGGDVGVPAMAIQQSSPADTAANGDYAMLQMSAGRLWGSTILEAGSQVIGHVIADTGSTTAVTGNVTVVQGTSTNLKADVTIAAAQTLATVTTVGTVTSLTQMNGAAISMGTGTRDAGTQRVTIATNDVVPASQSGTWTVQPGNTANTTAWLVTSGHGKTIKTVTGSIASNGNNDNVITAVSSKRLKIIAISLRTAYTTLLTATLKNQTTDSAIWTEVMQAVSGTLFGATQAMPAPSFFCATIAGEALRINLSAAQTVYYNITYFDDDAS